MEPGFNLKNAIGKGREEVNFYCGELSLLFSICDLQYLAVKANKVSPGEFGLPKGFVKCGNKIVHREYCSQLMIIDPFQIRKRKVSK